MTFKEFYAMHGYLVTVSRGQETIGAILAPGIMRAPPDLSPQSDGIEECAWRIIAETDEAEMNAQSELVGWREPDIHLGLRPPLFYYRVEAVD